MSSLYGIWSSLTLDQPTISLIMVFIGFLAGFGIGGLNGEAK